MSNNFGNLSIDNQAVVMVRTAIQEHMLKYEDKIKEQDKMFAGIGVDPIIIGRIKGLEEAIVFCDKHLKKLEQGKKGQAKGDTI